MHQCYVYLLHFFSLKKKMSEQKPDISSSSYNTSLPHSSLPTKFAVGRWQLSVWPVSELLDITREGLDLYRSKRQSRGSFTEIPSPQPRPNDVEQPLHSCCSPSIKTTGRESGVMSYSQFHSAKQVQECRLEPKERQHVCLYMHGTATFCEAQLWNSCMSFSSYEENTLYLQGLCVLHVCV